MNQERKNMADNFNGRDKTFFLKVAVLFFMIFVGVTPVYAQQPVPSEEKKVYVLVPLQDILMGAESGHSNF